MSPEEFSELVESIRKSGLKEPVTTYSGFIIDGKNRLRACRKAGVEPRFAEWESNGSLVEWALAKNMHRRNLTASQRAVIGADAIPLFEAEAQQRMKSGRTLPPRGGRIWSAEKAAAATGSSTRSVERAARLAREAPEKLEQIRAGKTTVKRAERELGGENDVADEAPPTDGLGNPVTDKELWPAFQSQEFRDVLSTIQQARKKLAALIESPVGAHLHKQTAESYLKAAYNDIKGSAPYSPCVYCKDGCKACRKKRWIPKILYDNSPEGLKR